jgi:hypothetical protein
MPAPHRPHLAVSPTRFSGILFRVPQDEHLMIKERVVIIPSFGYWNFPARYSTAGTLAAACISG